jgi:Asp-tRNA(Asn)/Glu-tRNA(Gln) amidotransferase A subunit family amidase
MEDKLFFESATRLAMRMRQREVSAIEFTQALIERIQSSQLNAYCTVAAAEAMVAASKAEALLRSGQFDERTTPLLGVPVSIKDNIETAGIRTTYGSKVFADNIPVADAVCVQRLKAAGAIIIGKTNLPEFATKGVVDSPLFGVTRNPWDLTRVVGGSSGGAAAAVAAGLGPLAVGNDQAGSVRMPAALCGVAGIKPTSGRIPFAPNLSPWDQLFQVGVLARTVDDLALGLRVMEGHHPDDPLSYPVSDGPSTFDRVNSVPRIAWSATVGFARIEPEVLAIVKTAVAALQSFSTVEGIDLDLSPATIAYATLVPFKRAIEVGHHLDGWAERMDPEVVTYIRGGLSMGVDEVRAALSARTSVYVEIERILRDHDFIVTPTLSVEAFKIGLTAPAEIDGVATRSFRDWFHYLYPFNLSGHPAVSVPAGFTSAGLPVGIQIIGPRFSDRALLALAGMLESEHPWADKYPPCT